ncbi:MAG: hypothetical protein J5708_08835 [Bacteroidales bacterium]|nr:hypothetical protein [Bacteroidales bacterium]
MKKAYKVTWISLASVLGVVLITVLIACYLVFSPKRLTSLVNKHASKFITCDYNFGRVDLTLFKTFPDAGLKINNLVLLNPTNGWTTDTLASIDECLVSLNIKEILFGDQIIVDACHLNGGFINAFFDTEGNNNFDIFPPDEAEEEPVEEESTSYSIDLDKLILNNIKIQYTDLVTNTFAKVSGLGMSLKGNIKDDNIKGDLDLSISRVMAKIDNDTMVMRAAIDNINVNGKVKMKGDDINADATIGTGAIGVAMTGSNNIEASLNSFKVGYKGDVNNYEHIKGLVTLIANGTTAVMDGEAYANNADINLEIPLDFDLNSNYAKFDKSAIRLNDIKLEFIGEATMKDAITLNMDFHTNAMIIDDIIRLMPEWLKKDLLGGIKINGKLILDSHVEGTYSENQMPVVNANVTLADGYFEMSEMLPYPLTGINTSIHTDLDLNGKSDVSINSFRARMNSTSVAASGTVNDVMDKMYCNLNLKTDLNFNDVKSFLPEDLKAQGILKANINLKGSAEQFTNLDLMHTRVNGNLDFSNLNVRYCDTISLNSSDMSVGFILPNPHDKALKDGLALVTLKGADLNADLSGTSAINAALNDFNISAQVSNVLDSTVMTSTIVDFAMSTMDFNMDDMSFHTNNAHGNALMMPSQNIGNISYAAVYSSDSLVFAMGNDMRFATDALAVNAAADYDETAEDIFLQWNPTLDLDLDNAVFETADISEAIVVPSINVTYGEAGLDINNSHVILGNSDFSLEGNLTNLYEHFQNKELLLGSFNFTSEYTDVNQLMDIFSGMGADSTEMAQNTADTTVKNADPFMVPYGVDIKLHTLIKSADAGDMKIRNVGGDLTIKDGILVLQEMGFTSDAAEMQLTAIYKSKRKNHLYAGFDFHLLDIDIAEMIHIIPDLDTIVPMLKSFDGKAEFHFAAETNLKADYTPKYSTLKAACSIEGQDLVVLDGETFDNIKRKLFFSKKTENKIDSLDVQFTVFKNEIDVYPFSVSMDKYSAMLYGRHNLDMSYDYNIAVLRPRMLSHLGLEVKGPDFDNMKFKVRRSVHRNMFKPEKRDYKEEKIAEIKKIISNSLKENVK